jgi:hypothetical protein
VSKRKFDWDDYFSTASFKQIRDRSPELSTRRVPSVYSPDRLFFYLTSLDIDVQTSEVTELRAALTELRTLYFSQSAAQSNYGKALARTDFIEICHLLADCDEDPEPYLDPDALLDSVRAGA